MSTVPAATPLQVRGRVWKFGDAVNTDEMFPGFAMRLPVAEAAQYMFNATRPGWPALVRPGDVIVGGRRFGLGSSRPVARLMLELGISCILAEEFSSLFMRNSINLGLAALTIPGVTSAVEEGDELEVDLESAHVRNVRNDIELTGTPLPGLALDIIRHGGVEERLRSQGYLD
jgi:3-isopropylmalate/(R)-2-methylmalate dehydratase small subunit